MQGIEQIKYSLELNHVAHMELWVTQKTLNSMLASQNHITDVPCPGVIEITQSKKMPWQSFDSFLHHLNTSHAKNFITSTGKLRPGHPNTDVQL